jgi:hypothetical protein
MIRDLFTSEGAPWAAFLLTLRGRCTVRVGQFAACPCGKTFIRTNPDPRALQICQVCEHDAREGYTTVPIAAPRRLPLLRAVRRVSP